MQVKEEKENLVGSAEPLVLQKSKRNYFSTWSENFPRSVDLNHKFVVTLVSGNGREKNTFTATTKEFLRLAEEELLSIKADTSFNTVLFYLLS